VAKPPTTDSGKRRPVVAQTAAPVKRSRHVAVLLMGTVAIGGGAYWARRAGLDGRLARNFDGRLSRSDPGGAAGVQASGFHLGLTFQVTGAIPNGFHASGECRGNKHP
jgi:hypothetical protein